jgi:pimeloyl-ACP methyl ester carboxylesterase
MATFVLVHGAWAGAHGFRHVRRRLQAEGDDVFTPSLTGIGERVHLASPQVTLATHVRDVVNQILFEDLDDIVLLGFSYGGMVVTGCLEHVAERVRHLVFLDAFLPDDGDTAQSLAGFPPPAPTALAAEWLVPPVPRAYDDPAEAAFMVPRRVPHPLGCFTEPVRLPRPLESYPFARTYIRATADDPGAPASIAFEDAARHARSSEAWSYREIASNHMVPSNRPGELAELLLECAR